MNDDWFNPPVIEFPPEWNRRYVIQPIRKWRWDRIMFVVYLLAGTFLSALGSSWYV